MLQGVFAVFSPVFRILSPIINPEGWIKMPHLIPAYPQHITLNFQKNGKVEEEFTCFVALFMVKLFLLYIGGSVYLCCFSTQSPVSVSAKL
jgi:hypothetical protein